MPSEIVQRVEAAAIECGLDAVVAVSPENTTYLAGFAVPTQQLIRSRLAICVAVPGGPSALAVVNMEESLARTECELDEISSYDEFTQHPVDALIDILKSRSLERKRIGIEKDYLPIAAFERLNASFNAEWVDTGDLFTELRKVKTTAEIAALRALARKAHEVHYEALGQVRAGDSEQDLAALIAEGLFRRGIEKILILIVGSGERCHLPNPSATQRTLRPGDMIRVDIIASSSNYVSDVARTAVVGEPSQKQQQIWRTHVEARDRAFEMIRPGASTAEIYARFADFFEAANLRPGAFLGHSLGLTVHEEPFLSRFSDTKLEAGMTLAIEPYYLDPDRNWGFQLEDEIVVTEAGIERLTDAYSDEELIVVEA